MENENNTKALFAENLTRLRKEAGLSQSNLAKLVGLTHNFINDLENMKKCASFKTVDQLSEALGVKPIQFFIDLECWNDEKDSQFLAILDNLNKNINRMFDNYRVMPNGVKH
jgi:transcriptional regulator with XRE-family HTH domain